MQKLTIHIPDDKASFIRHLLKELDVTIEHVPSTKSKIASHIPNSETSKAIAEAKKGKTKKITNFKSFFDSI